MLKWRQSLSTERLQVRAVLHQLHEHFIALEVNEVGRREGVTELAGEDFCIRVADAEGNDRPDIAEDSLPDWKRNLVDVLMR